MYRRVNRFIDFILLVCTKLRMLCCEVSPLSVHVAFEVKGGSWLYTIRISQSRWRAVGGALCMRRAGR